MKIKRISSKPTVKKNWVLRMMGICLMFTLVSTCLLGGTLAKYVTKGSGTDTARVAKWGVVVTSTGSDLFKTSYGNTETTTITNTVVSSTADRVVAPGTSGSAGGFSFTGTPEVACRVKVVVDTAASEIEYWTLGVAGAGTAYEPVVWSINGSVCGSNGTFAELLTALNSTTLEFAPGTDLSSVSTAGLAISWAWEFDNATGSNDVSDTYLGNKADAPTINLKYDVTVTQID